MLRVNETGSDLLLLTWSQASTSRSSVDSAEEAYRNLDAVLEESGAVPLQERVFADLSAMPCVAKGRARAVGPDSDTWAVPPTCVEGAPVALEGLAGIHVVAARAASSHLVCDGDVVLGRVVEAPSARFLGLADVGRRGVGSLPAAPTEDAATAIDAAIAVLEREGFGFRDVARTWFYLRDILDWYGSFNTVRNAAFRELGLLGSNGDGAIPASTGIEGRNLRGGWCTLDLLAGRGRDGAAFEMRRLHNRRQNEATEYGSAFARGMAVTLGDHRYVFVSGTASIDDHGATVHVGDFEAQLDRTLDAIAGVLEDAGAGLADLRQATSFLKSPCDRRAYERVMDHAGLSDLPALTTVADVCRDDLLFEMDATAVVPVGDPDPRS